MAKPKTAKKLVGSNRDDILTGTAVMDWIDGGNGNDLILGLGGDDLLEGGNHDDRLHGGDGDDELSGGNHDDRLYGDAGDDILDGGNHDDLLIGGSGSDSLAGGSGNDDLDGGQGADALDGGSGNDLLRFDVAGAGGGRDTYAGGAGIDTLVVRLTSAQYTAAVRGELIGFLDWAAAAGANRGEVRNGSFLFSTLNLQVSQVEKLNVYVNDVLVDPRATVVSPADATDDAFGIAEDASISGSVAGNDLFPAGSSFTLILGVSRGVLVLNANGSFNYLASGFDSLAAGQTATESFTYELRNPEGRTDRATVTLTITGTNDAAVVTAQTGADLAVAEDGDGSASGRFLVADADSGQAAIDPAKSSAARYGTFAIAADGAWTYALNQSAPAVQALAAGEKLVDTITVKSVDGSATGIVEIVITGTNDTAAIASASGADLAAVEDGDGSASGRLVVTDVDNGQAAVDPATASGARYGSFAIAASGAWTYILDQSDAAVQALAAGAQLVETVTVKSADGTATGTVEILITGTNDAATVTAQAGADLAVAEDGDASASGRLVVTDVDSGQAAVDPGTATGARYGSFAIAADGSWTYALDQSHAAVQALAAGAQLVETVTVKSADGSATGTVEIVITGTNDAATIAAQAEADLATVEDGDGSASGRLVVTDIDSGEAAVDPSSATGARYGSFAIAASGAWTYVLDQTDAAVQALAAGAQLVDSVTVRSADGSATATVEIVITGTNDLAIVTAQPGADLAVAEDVDGSASGRLIVTDVDGGQAATDPASATGAVYGSFAIDASGAWTYALDQNHAAVQALAAGAQLVETIAVKSADGTATATVEIVITGTNDIATVTAQPGADLAVAEDRDGSASGRLVVTDVDSGQAAIDPATAAGARFGSFVIAADGSWTYVLDQGDAAVQALAAGEQLVETITVKSADGTATATVEIVIAGTDDAAVVTPQPGADLAVVEDADGSASGRFVVTDADGGQGRIDPGSAAGARYGSFAIQSDGNWTYALDQSDATVQALAAGDQLVETITVRSADGSATGTVEIVITGTNDAATIAAGPGADFAVSEDADAVASGQLLVSDVDTGEAAIDPASATDALYGSFVIDAAGHWTYTLDSAREAVQSLRDGATLGDSVTVKSADGTSHVIAISITGTNDVPVLASAAGPQALATGDDFTLQIAPGAFTDADAGDALVLSATLEGGAALPGWLGFDPATGLFSGTPGPADGGSFVIALTATDGSGASAVDLISFTVDGAEPPPAATLRLAASDAAADGDTVSGAVTLVGTAQAGTRINLYDDEGGALIDTTIADVVGAFRFTNVALTLGDNDFVVESVDEATGLSTLSGEYVITRDPLAPEAEANGAIFWNTLALGVVALSGATPAFATRALAMESQAVYNVIAAIEGMPGFQFNAEAPDGASVEAAIAQAAHDILVHLFPGQAGMLGQALAQRLGGLGEGVAEGRALGGAVADQIIEIRAGDGWDESVIEIGGEAPGQWQPSGPFYMPGETPQWADVDTFLLDSASQYRPDAPPSLLHDTVTDDQYASDLERTLALGRAVGSDRTPDQEAVARFWADGGGTHTPPGHWNAIATQVAADEGLSLSSTANLLLQLNLAEADAAIAAWDAKFTYDMWRPITVAQGGAVIDGVAISADPDWRPLLNTPAHPDYVSGHSTFSAVGATILTAFFGDDYAFSTTSSSIPGGTVVRHFDSFWDAALEAGASRIYAGIHWESSNLGGRELGIDIAEHVLNAFDSSSDTVAPRMIFREPSGTVTDEAPQISGYVTDNLAGVASLLVSIDGSAFVAAPFAANGAFTLPTNFATDGSDDGVHRIQFVVADAAGNESLVAWDFVLATQAPDIVIAADGLGGSAQLGEGSRLIGSVDLGDGNALASLSYRIDGGSPVSMSFREDGSFDASVAFAGLDEGAHQIVITAVDLAGNIGTETLSVTAPEASLLTITNLTPDDSEGAISLHYRPLIEFSEAVDVTTLTAGSLYATDASGAQLQMRIVPLENGKGAWMFFEDDLPGSQAVTLHVDGDLIATADGKKLDADGDGTEGGDLDRTFTTVSNSAVPGTVLTGRILDPGNDLVPMTPDDFRAGPEGATDWDGNTYKNPLAGVKVYVMGHEDGAVFTDAQGNFTLTDIPAGSVKIVVDGRTATNAPEGSFFPEMVMDVKVRPGVENTIMSGMGDRETQVANIGNQAVYLPRIPEASLVELSDTEPTVIQAVTGAGSTQSASQLSQMSLTVQPGSLVDAEGNPVENAQVGIALVPTPIVANMFPTGIFQQAATITIQAPGGAVFTEEATLTMPNIYGMAPGSKTFVLSFDHTTGQIVVDGTATVSADGLSITSDPGSGIDQPGWHAITPPTHGVDGGAPPPPCPPADGGVGISAGDLTDAAEGFGIGYALGGAQGGARMGLLDNRIQNVMDDIATAANGGGTNGLGEADAGYFAIKGFELLGLTAETAFTAGQSLIGRASRGQEKGLKPFDTAIKAARAYEASVNGTAENIAEAANGKIKGMMGDTPPKSGAAASAAADALAGPSSLRALSGEASGFSSLANEVPDYTSAYPELQAATADFDEAIFAYRGAVDQLAPLVETVIAAAEAINAILMPEGASKPLEGVAIEELVTIDPDTGALVSELLDHFRALFEAVQQIEEIGFIGDFYDKMVGSFERVVGEFTEAFADDPPELGDDVHGPDGGAAGGYAYNHTLYGAAKNVATGEIVRFSFAPQDGWEVFLDPDARYQLSFLDPASGYVATTMITTGAAGERTEDYQPPIFLPDTSSVMANGLTATASMIVGVDPTRESNLFPGSGVSDAEALLGGADSPQLLNQVGPTGAVDLLGEALAIELGGTEANGGGLTAYVATGTHGLAIVAVGNPSLPTIMSQMNLDGIATDVAVSESQRLVAVARGDAGVAVIDVSNPVRPAIVYELAGATGEHVEMIGADRFAVASGGTISVYDIGSGTLVQSLQLVAGPNGPAGPIAALEWDGERLLAATGGQGSALYVIQSANGMLSGQARAEIGATTAIGANAIGVSGDIVFVGLAGNVLASFDVSDASAPVRLDTSDAPIAGDAVALNGSGLGLSVSSGVGALSNVLDVFNAGDAASADGFVRRVRLGGDEAPLDLELTGRTAFLARGEAGLQVVTYAAFDTAGVAPTVAPTALPVDADPDAPGLQLVEGSLLTLGAMVTDDVVVRGVDLLVNGRVVANDITSRFSLDAFLPTIAGIGGTAVTIQLRATDTGGNFGFSAPIVAELIPNPSPLAIVSIAPEGGSGLGEGRNLFTVTFSRALDPVHVAAERFSLISESGAVLAPTMVQLLDGDTRLRLAFDIPELENGTYSFGIDAPGVYDRAGNALGDAPVTIEYVASNSDVIWISPTGGAWDVGANWSTGQKPGAEDSVLVRTQLGTAALVRNDVGQIGRLDVAGEGELRLNGAPRARLEADSLVNRGNVVLIDNGDLFVDGQLTNIGSLSLTGSAGLTVGGDVVNSGTLVIGDPDPDHRGEANGYGLRLTAAVTRLSGGGTVEFNNFNSISDSPLDAADQLLIIQDQVITGGGEFSGLSLVFEAESSLALNGGFLEIYSSDVTNRTVLHVDGDDGMVIGPDGDNDSMHLDNREGAIRATGDDGYVYIYWADIEGGTYDTNGYSYMELDGSVVRGGTFTAAGESEMFFYETIVVGGVLSSSDLGVFTLRGGTLSGTEAPLILDGFVQGVDEFYMRGAIENRGVISIDPGISYAFGELPLLLSGDTTVTGGGTITTGVYDFSEEDGDELFGIIGSQAAQSVYETDPVTGEQLLVSTRGYTLTNVDNLITGAGLIGALGDDGVDMAMMSGAAARAALRAMETDIEYRLAAVSVEETASNGFAEVPRLTLINQASGAIENGAGQTLTISYVTLQNDGSISATNSGAVIIAESTLTNDGEIIASAATISVDAGTSFVNDGSIRIQDGGALDLAGSLAGTGSILMGDGDFSFDGIVDQLVDVSRGDAMIGMGASAVFDGTLLDFAVGDAVELEGIGPGASLSFLGGEDGGTLTISDGSDSVSLFLRYEDQSELLNDPQAHFFLASNGEGGSILTTDMVI